MQAYGSDRIRRDGERMTLSCRVSKGWTARVEKTYTSAEFPGTAVLWEGRYFEVVVAEVVAAGGVRYVLEPWLDHHAMRVTDRYDAESEAQRAEELRKQQQREKHRKSANALALLTGHLPAVVQEELGREVGILPPRLTLVSIFGVYAVIAAIVLFIVRCILAQQPIPFLPLVIAIYLGIENSVRFFINWTQSRPIGSPLGWIAYLLFYGSRRRGPSPFAVEKGWSTPIPTAPAEVAARDAFAVREPLVTLLTPADQRRIAERFGYDYRRHSKIVATFILVFSVLGVITAFRTQAPVTTVVAAIVAAEQVIRLVALRRGPAGSVLRFLAWPFMRKLLADHA